MDTIKLILPAGQAVSTPPVGPLLGQKGVNAIDFCKQFNEATKMYHSSVQLPVKILVENRKFSFSFSYPTTVSLLKKAALLKKSNGSRLGILPQVDIRWVYLIAEYKLKDPKVKLKSVKSFCKTVLAVAKSMNIEVTA